MTAVVRRAPKEPGTLTVTAAIAGSGSAVDQTAGA